LKPEIERRPSLRMPGQSRRPRSGVIAALLSVLFPGLGHAYLGRSKDAAKFAMPVVFGLMLLAVAVVAAGGIARFGARIIDPTIAFATLVVVILVGLWWIIAMLHAWRFGEHGSGASIVALLALVLVVGAIDGYGAMSLWRIRNADIAIFTGDPTLEEAPSPSPSPTKTPAGKTPDPLATPTQRPPDYVDPSENPTDEPEPSLAPGPTPGYDITQIDAESDGLLNVLLAGVDWMPGRVGARTDTMLVVSVNSATGEVLMFSFPRDLQRFPIYNGGTYSGKLNTFAGVSKRYPDQFPDPGMPALAHQIGFMLGVPIDYYASVNMPGFMTVVDAVGGVTVHNERQIADDHLQFYLSPGEHRLNPADALRFVRSRKGQSGGDFARAKRQQAMLAGLRREMLKPQNLARMPDVVEALSQVINTNFPPERIDQLLALAETVEEEPSRSWVFKNPDWAELLRRRDTGLKRTILTPRMDKIGELSIELFGEKSLYNGQQ
jgi:LCP family protein required for cell wall assembly